MRRAEFIPALDVGPSRGVERGAVSVVLVAVIAVGLLCGLGAGRLGVAAVDAERAQAVADVSALAGAVAQEPAARAVAHANAAQWIGLRRSGSTVVVELRRSGATAVAAASPMGVLR